MFEEPMEAMRLARAKTVEYLAFLLLTTLLAGVFAFVWSLSALGFGFVDGPANPTIKKIALATIAASYFVGMPALLIGQAASPILWFFGRTRGAYVVPLLSMGSFLLCATAAFLLW
jgi:hypothetical protein